MGRGASTGSKYGPKAPAVGDGGFYLPINTVDDGLPSPQRVLASAREM